MGLIQQTPTRPKLNQLIDNSFNEVSSGTCGINGRYKGHVSLG